MRTNAHQKTPGEYFQLVLEIGAVTPYHARSHHPRTPHMKRIALAALLLSLISGCVYDSFDFTNKTFTRWSILQDVTVQTVVYDPTSGEFSVEGVDSKAELAAIAAVVEALK